MSLTALKGKFTVRHRASQQERDIARAISTAPTLASQQELLHLLTR